MQQLNAVVGKNVRQIREDYGWTQNELATRLSGTGGRWTPQTVAMLESKGVRAEKIGDLLLVCITFGVPLVDLLECDTPVTLPGDVEVDRRWISDAVTGKGPRPEASINDGTVQDIAIDDAREVRRIARLLDMTVEDLRDRTRELSKVTSSPTVLRDYIARLRPGMEKDDARTRRGHATRKLAEAIRDPYYAINSGDDTFPIYEVDFKHWHAEVMS